MIEFALSTYLKSRPTISAIVGTRVYASRAPQKTATQDPVQARIVYRLLPGTERYYHTTAASGLVRADIELLCVAKTYSDARDLYEAIRNEIDGFSGLFDTTTIDQCMLTTPVDATGNPTQGDDVGYPCVSCVAEIVYQESVPVPVNE